ncbi:MAG: sensor domain-containing diguanylate cyclase [Candidatus Omnitrophica bacterium]|nr:sensor domain-containing diguanylate cyclase [Candidatus Omnitrophota bacterium]MBU4590195.1 sensor domain-containing diguanylate cyclase [Candidatus Omnitrophota bacterium]
MKKNFKEAYHRAQAELEMLYEIGNAMHVTLNLEKILYIILTSVTSHVGLSFNRAMLLLVNEKENRLEGKMGIGPDSAEDANAVWSHIEKHKMGFDELIETRSQLEHLNKSQLNKTVRSIKIPISDDSGVVAATVMEGMPFAIISEKAKQKTKSEISQILNLEEFVTVPLKARDKTIGVIVADNLYTKKPITNDHIRMLTTFANQAGLAIENSRLYERTVVLSNSDSLTGLWHHGYFQYLLGQEIEYASSRKQPFTILMIDIDDFKKFNDTHGHQAGDAILRSISSIFKTISKRIDIVARYGGEEFVILLPATKKEEAIVLAERLRNAIEESKDIRGITISTGVASFPEDGKEKESLISSADRALYQAKRTGKNKVCS